MIFLTLNDEEEKLLTNLTDNFNKKHHVNLSRQKFLIKLFKDYNEEEKEPVKK